MQRIVSVLNDPRLHHKDWHLLFVDVTYNRYLCKSKRGSGVCMYVHTGGRLPSENMEYGDLAMGSVSGFRWTRLISTKIPPAFRRLRDWNSSFSSFQPPNCCPAFSQAITWILRRFFLFPSTKDFWWDCKQSCLSFFASRMPSHSVTESQIPSIASVTLCSPSYYLLLARHTTITTFPI